MVPPDPKQRTLGLFGATSVGVGAIVGGGVLALAGTAFAQTGPSAVLAFALNGCIALLTALSFSEVASKFPESGGTYTFAKKVLSVEAAFTVGWTVWFASIVAAALYAIGFSQFAIASTSQIASAMNWVAVLEVTRLWWLSPALAVSVIVIYTGNLLIRSGGGGHWENIGKLFVFLLLIALGFWVLRERSFSEVRTTVTPFFQGGAAGLFQAMGYTFIAVQGFDLIAAVGGEVRQPEKNIPRAMMISLGIALAIYIPLLFVVSTAGMAPGQSIAQVSRENPETVIAIAAQNYLGVFGFWLVMVAGVLSMVSAMQANLFAASRVAMSMARDRTLPGWIARTRGRHHIPRMAVVITAGLVGLTVIALPNVAAAGAASSLIFLITFALAHWICILVRQRSTVHPPPFRTRWFPLIPAVGGVACLILAVYQGCVVPVAGAITVCWLGIGGILFLVLFAHRARLSDVTSEIRNPELLRMRGRSPLVLVPIANPESASGLVGLANALTPAELGRVLLLSVAVPPDEWDFQSNAKPLENTQLVLRKALASSVHAGLFPEALTTIAANPWEEIKRVAKTHRCESLLLGLTRLEGRDVELPLERLLLEVSCDVVILKAPKDWDLRTANRILVPTTGQRIDDPVLARLLAGLSRAVEREINFLSVLPESRSPEELRAAHHVLNGWVHNLCSSNGRVSVIASDDPTGSILQQAAQSDLLILSIDAGRQGQPLLSPFAREIVQNTDCPILLARKR